MQSTQSIQSITHAAQPTRQHSKVQKLFRWLACLPKNPLTKKERPLGSAGHTSLPTNGAPGSCSALQASEKPQQDLIYFANTNTNTTNNTKTDTTLSGVLGRPKERRRPRGTKSETRREGQRARQKKEETKCRCLLAACLLPLTVP